MVSLFSDDVIDVDKEVLVTSLVVAVSMLASVMDVEAIVVFIEDEQGNDDVWTVVTRFVVVLI
jgi:hypothetical protein